MRTYIVIMTSLFLAVLQSCQSDVESESYAFPAKAENFSAVNGPYDDMNSAAPPEITDFSDFIFSTNRFSAGGTFDFAYYTVGFEHDPQLPEYVPSAYAEVKLGTPFNSDANEFGPFFAFRGESLHAQTRVSVSGAARLLFFASDRTGSRSGLNLWASGPVGYFHSPEHYDDAVITELTALSSDSDDAYITFGHDNTVYFCSNRDGNFDIYQYSSLVTLTTDNVLSVLSDSANARLVEKALVFNSEGDDKCPYIHNNTLFFISNRSGGYGGFDIYRSDYIGNSWSEPILLGLEINSEADEYRPFCASVQDFTNRILVFSSDRPGGLGGFDLYFAAQD